MGSNKDVCSLLAFEVAEECKCKWGADGDVGSRGNEELETVNAGVVVGAKLSECIVGGNSSGGVENGEDSDRCEAEMGSRSLGNLDEARVGACGLGEADLAPEGDLPLDPAPPGEDGGNEVGSSGKAGELGGGTEAGGLSAKMDVGSSLTAIVE